LADNVRRQILAKKMTVLYKLAREQLSKQYHYDFGLRALKSVLVMAGELKRSAADLPEVRNQRRRSHHITSHGEYRSRPPKASVPEK